MEPELTLDDLEIPWLWEGVERGWSRPESVGFALGALAQVLASHPHGDDEDRFLVRALVSLDGPRGDRVWVDVEQKGRPMSLRTFVADRRERGHDFGRQGLAPWCAALRHDYAHAFDVTPAEAYARCMPHYHGYLHAWTDEHHARAGFKDWSPSRQGAFLHEYLLYAANNASFHAKYGEQGDPGLQEAAAWLKSRRRYFFRWTFVAREEPRVVPAWLKELEAPLVEAWADLQTAIQQTPDAKGWLHSAEEATDLLFTPPTVQSPLQETLDRLGAGTRLRHRAYVFEVLQGFVDRVSGTFPPPAGPALEALRARIKEASRSGW